jgi:hypothetical protein
LPPIFSLARFFVGKIKEGRSEFREVAEPVERRGDHAGR